MINFEKYAHRSMVLIPISMLAPLFFFEDKMSTKHVTDKMVCEAYREMKRQRDAGQDCEFPHQILQRMTGQPEKVCYRAMERADDRGLVDYGVSLRTGWLTDEGIALLQSTK